MTDRPIIFSAPMIRALIDGRKTMTRRLAGSWRKVRDPVEKGKWLTGFRPTLWQCVKPGDRLWVKETFFHYQEKCKDSSTGFVDWLHYRATDEDDFLPGMKWKPSIYMPRAHSRLTLVVTATKIERLQAISEADAAAEGWQKHPEYGTDPEIHRDAARDWFSDLWTDLHGVESWVENPEVVAISFTVHKQNIDAIPKDNAA